MTAEIDFERRLEENFERYLTDGFLLFKDQIGALQTVVFYGVGDVFRHHAPRIIKYLKRLDVKVYCCDDDQNKWGKTFSDILCISPDELLKEWQDCGVIITVENNAGILDFLNTNKLRHLSEIQPWVHSKFFLRNKQLDPETYLVRAGEAASLFSDDKSRQVFNAVFSYPLLNPEDLSGIRTRIEQVCEPAQYFVNELVRITGDECFVDGGAYNGDTFLEFYKKSRGLYSHYYAFELCPTNFIALQKNLVAHQNITLFNLGLWDKKDTIAFSGNSAGSVIGRGEKHAEVIDLDSVLQSQRVTFIKMDIEGAELAALEGAKQIIKNQKPVLAISVYHRMNHFFEVPLLIKRMCPEYKIYLRQHAEIWCNEILETVCYAIPPLRQ